MPLHTAESTNTELLTVNMYNITTFQKHSSWHYSKILKSTTAANVFFYTAKAEC